MAEANNVNLLDLEDQLEKDTGGGLRDRLVAELAEYAKKAKRELDAGLGPEEYKTVDELRQAAERAQQIVNISWSRFHAGS